MSRFGDLIIRFREDRGLSQRDAAAALGLSPAGLGKVERGETARPNNWEGIAAKIGIGIEEANAMIDLDAADSEKASKVSVALPAPALVTPRFKLRRVSPGKTPIVGMAAAGDSDRLVMLNDVVDEIATPPYLAGVEGAYALFVHGTSMVPRYYPGELVFVHPHKPMAPDRFCVVQVGRDKNSPEGGFIKQFKSWNDGKLIVAQFNPERTIEFPANEVVDVHRIVGSGGD